MRKSEPTKATRGNVAKADSYNEARARIKSAKENGFYIEAVAIMESIVCDRILSYLHTVHDFPLRTKKDWHHNMSNLVKEVRSRTTLTDQEGRCIWDLLDKWRRQRNEIVHRLVRSDPGEPTLPVDEFLETAKECCKHGEELVKHVINWNKRAKRKAKSPER